MVLVYESLLLIKRTTRSEAKKRWRKRGEIAWIVLDDIERRASGLVWFERAKKTRADRMWLRWAMGGRGKSQGRQDKNNEHGPGLGRTRFGSHPA